MIIKDNVPMYEQIKGDILQKIESNIYILGQKLPSERELAELYNVSRVTIRQSVEDLVNRGYLQKRPGSGTYVKEARIEQPMARLSGIVDELQQQGFAVKIDVIETTFEKYSGQNKYLWNKLNRPDQEQIYKIKRALYANGEPLLIDYNYFPEEIGLKYDNFDLSKDVIFKGLEDMGYRIDYAEQKISARAATASQAKLLKISQGEVVLDVERIVYSHNEIPLVFTRAAFAGDKYSYSVILKR